VEEDPAEQEIIEKIQSLKYQGFSFPEIARELDKDGYKTKKGGKLTHVQVSLIYQRAASWSVARRKLRPMEITYKWFPPGTLESWQIIRTWSVSRELVGMLNGDRRIAFNVYVDAQGEN
jgi:hypothetical protein